MALRKRKPTSPGRRFQTVSDFSEITKDRPEKSLIGPNPSSGIPSGATTNLRTLMNEYRCWLHGPSSASAAVCAAVL